MRLRTAWGCRAHRVLPQQSAAGPKTRTQHHCKQRRAACSDSKQLSVIGGCGAHYFLPTTRVRGVEEIHHTIQGPESQSGHRTTHGGETGTQPSACGREGTMASSPSCPNVHTHACPTPSRQQCSLVLRQPSDLNLHVGHYLLFRQHLPMHSVLSLPCDICQLLATTT
jgi:hypothetical protein